jgi:hypothetical protein
MLKTIYIYIKRIPWCHMTQRGRLSVHISPGFCRRGNPMKVIDDCTVFFFGILPHTLLPTGKISSPKKKTVEPKFSELSLRSMSPSLS